MRNSPTSKTRRTRAAKRPDRTTTLGTRLTDEERTLIEEAARLKAWSPAQFVRDAALERARH